MERPVAIYFIGGLLGAGKTTAIRGLSKILSKRGHRVGVITNDQTDQLVDTALIRNAGLPVREVTGSCLCCNFNGLYESILDLIDRDNPDVILAEPVGSCTDIVATVIRPATDLMGSRIQVRPFSVLMDPLRKGEMIMAPESEIWSLKYLSEKQLEEADFIVVNKADMLSLDKLDKIRDEIASLHPQANVIRISAKNGTGLEEWLDLVDASTPGERWLKDINYDTYAAAEAEMGWLNARVFINLAKPTSGEAFSVEMLRYLLGSVADKRGHVGNLKLIASNSDGWVKVGATRTSDDPDLEGGFPGPASDLSLTVNMRATLSPETLESDLTAALNRMCEKVGARFDVSYLNTFRPAPPRPTYRYNREIPK
jgi:G3E family GTPase